MPSRASAKAYLERALAAGAALNAYDSRSYQISAAHRCAEALAKGQDVILTLPTGTGKTLVCGMVAALFLREQPEERVLFTAPRVGLLGQLRERTRWLSPTAAVTDVGLNPSHDNRHLLPLLDRGRVVFAMARWLANRISSGLVPYERVKEFRLLIVDEFDAYLTLDYAQGGVRFHEDLDALMKHLHPDCRLLLVSATTPEPPSDPGPELESAITAGQEQAFRRFLDEEISPEYVSVPESSYRDFIPHAEIRATGVNDPWVQEINAGIDGEISLHLNWIVGAVRAPISAAYIFPRIGAILSGVLPLVPGRSITLTPHLRYLLRRLKWASHLGDSLFEDMAAGFETYAHQTTKYDLLEDKWRPAIVVRIATSPEISDRLPSPQAKLSELNVILREHPDERGVIFFRNIRILERIADELLPRHASLVRYHGNQRREQNTDALRRFRNGEASLLLITRDSGKRGLDLPEGDYAVFYSPKSRDDVTWQEVSRIRSTTSNPKPTHILYYVETAEEAKWIDLAAALTRSTRSIEIVERGAATAP